MSSIYIGQPKAKGNVYKVHVAKELRSSRIYEEKTEFEYGNQALLSSAFNSIIYRVEQDNQKSSLRFFVSSVR